MKWSTLMKNNQQKKHGFTLIELLLVIGIIAILAAIVIMAINPSANIETAQNASAKRQAKELQNAIVQHIIEHGAAPNGITSTPKILCADNVPTPTGVCELVLKTSLANVVDSEYNYIAQIPRAANADRLKLPPEDAGFRVSTDGVRYFVEPLVTVLSSPISPVAYCGTPGSLDATFNPGTGLLASGITPLTPQILNSAYRISDGSYYLAGTFTSYNGTARNRIARIFSGGLLDATFNPGTGANSTVYTVDVQSDGKVILGGLFNFFNSVPTPSLVRLNSDGTVDNTFAIGTGPNAAVHSVLVLSDGKILIAGEFSSFNGTARNNIARLNADGSLDSSFVPWSGLSSYPLTVLTQSDGKILVMGSYYHATRPYIARLNADGSLDNSFMPTFASGPNGGVYNAQILPSGKIYIVGDFTTVGGLTRIRVALLNSDGTVDPSFTMPVGPTSGVYDIVVDTNGKIIIGGWFSTIGASAVPYLARFNADGSLDSSFVMGTGPSSIVHSITLQPDNRILIRGSFTSYNGSSISRVARICN